jgi:tetrahydromethanopterin S-methyltransferase subunit A
MKEALDATTQAFRNDHEAVIRDLIPTIERYQNAMEPIAYDCIGCKKCWGADAIIKLADSFEEVEPNECSCNDDGDLERIPTSVGSGSLQTWPPHAGDYIVGNPRGSVAICTLSTRELSAKLIAAAGADLAIAGRCDTENIGIEKVVLNLIANPSIRWLILCGIEAQGHRAADAFLQLKQRGVDANMRVLKTASWRPVLKNLTLLDVAQFRQQIELVNMIGVTAVNEIVAATHEVAKKPTSPFSFQRPNESDQCLPKVERLHAHAPKTLRLDKAGFFVVLPQPTTGSIICEHYENSGRLAHVIEGRQAALVAATVIEKGLVTQLDHAAYLGRELAKAELALKTGAPYEQDAALRVLTTPKNDSSELCGDSTCSCHAA